MNYKNAETDSGSYVNGIYTTKNGHSGSGLNCPKGTRLYDTSVIQPVFFLPEDTEVGEDFEMINQEVCPDILPYYAISNYGRVLNVNSGKIMKPNYRPNGYEYYCLAAENSKYGQKKYNVHRIVMKTFDPREDADDLQVNHANGDKTQNYYKKVMEDGTIQSNLEWSTPKENIDHAHKTGLNKSRRVNSATANHMRRLRDEGYSYSRIKSDFYPDISMASIQLICKNLTYTDPNYVPKTINDSYTDNTNNNLKLSDKDAEFIRKLYKEGYKYNDIKEKFYPDVSICTLSDIVRGKTHNRNL